MPQAFIVDAVRTPVGRFAGALAHARPDDLAALTIKKLLEKNGWLEPALIDDVVIGAANQSGEDNRNVGRMAALLAGLPETVPGVTVNRLCASGLQSIADAARAIRCKEGSIYLAGGAESMTRAPYVMAKSNSPFERGNQLYDTTLGWRFTNPRLAALYEPISMGETAENVARERSISREDQDAYALRSQQRYAEAERAGKWAEEIVPVEVPGAGKGETLTVSRDEHPRETSLEKLAQLKPAFRKDGSVTAGNSAGINDGAAMCLVVSGDVVKEYGLKPLGRVVAVAAAGVNPLVMGLGPVPAIRKVLQTAGLSLKDIGLVDINEAFAAQVLACQRELGIDPEKLNVNGGAIAIGHPLGMSGTRLTASLLREMRRRGVRYGIASMCIGVGQGLAAVVEAVDN